MKKKDKKLAIKKIRTKSKKKLREKIERKKG